VFCSLSFVKQVFAFHITFVFSSECWWIAQYFRTTCGPIRSWHCKPDQHRTS